METLWPWLAVAGLGALHGLNPTTGWLFAAAWGLRARDRRQALRALLPLAVGHAASIAVVAAAVAFGLSMNRLALQTLAAVMLAGLLLYHLTGHATRHARPVPTGQLGLALWSFIMATAHGAGLMLLPALIPVCMGGASTRAITVSGSLMMACAAVLVHTLAMLAVTGLIATGLCSGVKLGASVLRRRAPSRSPEAR